MPRSMVYLLPFFTFYTFTLLHLNTFTLSVSDPDPDQVGSVHWPGSVSGNVDLDPGTKKKS